MTASKFTGAPKAFILKQGEEGTAGRPAPSGFRPPRAGADAAPLAATGPAAPAGGDCDGRFPRRISGRPFAGNRIVVAKNGQVHHGGAVRQHQAVAVSPAGCRRTEFQMARVATDREGIRLTSAREAP